MSTPRLTEVYVRTPFYVDAVRVTDENFLEVASWCGGEVLLSERKVHGLQKKYIKVPVKNPQAERHTMGYVGDWVVNGSSGFRVYTRTSFKKNFEMANPVVKSDSLFPGPSDTYGMGTPIYCDDNYGQVLAEEAEAIRNGHAITFKNTILGSDKLVG